MSSVYNPKESSEKAIVTNVKTKRMHLILCNLLILIGVTLMSEPLNAKEILVQVENVDTKKAGNILVMLFGKEGFPKNHSKAIATKVIPATKQSMQVKFDSVPEEFAIKVLHDEDESGTVTKNWTGIIPSEGLGFSNGAKLNFGPPGFKKAKLNLSTINLPLKLKVIYP